MIGRSLNFIFIIDGVCVSFKNPNCHMMSTAVLSAMCPNSSSKYKDKASITLHSRQLSENTEEFIWQYE